ncbi:MAG: Na+/H+ antiporter subunit E [Candidatus Latescibacterota bacterium]|nr:Na+/H+ antiporter subunit E [Candidatus Latescibacterota bacterium]
MARAASLGVFLAATWLLWSGYYQALTMAFGAASCLFVVWISRRMYVADHEAHPVHIAIGLLTYVPWLAWAIIKSNLDVALRLLNPGKLNISPRMVRIQVSQKSDLGKVIYANSITLTPGTVTMAVEENEFLVHTLTQEAEDDLRSGEMDGKCTRLEGGAAD